MIVPSYFFPRLEKKPCIYDTDLRKMQYRSPKMNFIPNFAFCETWDCDVLSAEIMARNYGERTKAKDSESGDG